MRSLDMMAVVLLFAFAVATGAAQAERLTFVVNAGALDQEAWETIAATYTERTGTEVELLIIPWEQYHEKLSTMIASGTPPDILFYSARFIVSLAADGAFEDHTHYAEVMQGAHEVFPAGFDEVTINGQLYGIPSDLNVSLIALNADMFAAGGLVSPVQQWKAGTWTWNAFLEAARRLTRDLNGDGVPDQAGTANFSTWAGNWPVWFWTNGARILSEDRRSVAANSLAGIEALTFVSELSLVHRVTGGRWQDGTTGMWVAGLNTLQSYRQQIGYNWDIVPFPVGPSGSGTSATYFGGGYSILKDAPNKEAAYRFLDFLVSEEVEEIRTRLAARLPIKRNGVQRFLDSEHRPDLKPANLDLIMDIIAAARPLPIVPVWNEMEAVWWEEVRPVLNGAQPANYGLNRFAERVNPILASW